MVENCVVTEVYRTPALAVDQNTNPPAQVANATQTIDGGSWVTSAKFYVPSVTLSINDDIKFVENIEQGF